MALKSCIFSCLFLLTATIHAASPLAPLEIDNPRQTYTSFLDAMNDYRKGVENKDPKLRNRIRDAVQTLQLDSLPTLTRNEQGQRAAIFLKEVLDRVASLDPNAIPDTKDSGRWRIPETEIAIILIEEGEHKGEYLFSTQTVLRAEEYYEKVKDLPYLPDTGLGALYTPSWEVQKLPRWMQGETFGFRHWQILGLFLGIFIGFALKGAVQVLLRWLQKWAAGSSGDSNLVSEFFLSIEKPFGLAFASLIWLAFIYALRFEGQALTFLVGGVQIILGVCVVWAIYKWVDVLGLWLEARMEKGQSVNTHLLSFIKKSLRVFVVVFGMLLILQNLGINVMSILAGLGLGGLAFALAAKDTAANLFGSIMILIDRPFRVGDFINVGGVEGDVEEIGFRSTRLRTLYDSVISIPNSSLVITNVDNYGAREYRRTRAILGLTYDTPPEKIEAFLDGIQNILLANPKTRKDLFHVYFDGYGDFSLNILVNFFIRAPTIAHELSIRQNIFLEILRLAQDLKVDFAFPTSTLHMETFPEKKPAINRHDGWTADQLKAAAEAFAPGGRASRPQGFGIHKRPHFAKLDE